MESKRSKTHLRIDTNRKVNSKLRGPLSVINIPQSLSTHQSIVPVLDTCVEDKYDLMEIHVTIYNISGVCGTRDKLFRKRRSSLSSLVPRVAKLQPSESGVTGPFHVPSLTDSLESIEGPKEDGVPITAVVSCHRNAISSSTALETFLPSLPLVASPHTGTGCHRYQASWVHKKLSNQGPVSTETCTFKILRAMKREGYRPGLSIEDICNYSPETIDLNVLLGHRQDLLSLGVATVVVTGDEEVESILNVPVKPSATSASTLTTSRAGPAKTTRKKSTRSSFPHDPVWTYSLADNATLRVGIRALPFPNENTKHDEKQRQSSSKLIKVDDDIIIELEGDSPLTGHMIMADVKRVISAKEDPTADAVRVKRPPVPSRLLCPPIDLVCSDAINLLPVGLLAPPDDRATKIRESSKVIGRMVPKNQSAPLTSFPASLLSSLSNSTEDSDGNSKSKSLGSFGESHLRSVQRIIETNLYDMQQKIMGDDARISEVKRTLEV